MKRQFTATLVALTFQSCASLHGPAEFEGNLSLSDAYIFRGVPQNENGVVQADATTSISAGDRGTLAFGAWGNMDLSNDTGDAVFPDGNKGEFSEIDLILSYARPIGSTDLEIGIIGYQFPNKVGSSTNELYVTGSWDLYGLAPALSLYWDWDQIDGVYLNGSVSRGFEISEKTSAEAGASLALSDSNHAKGYYASSGGGLGDARVHGNIAYAWDEHTKFSASLNLSTIVDSKYEDDLDAVGLETNNIWFALGVSWSL